MVELLLAILTLDSHGTMLGVCCDVRFICGLSDGVFKRFPCHAFVVAVVSETAKLSGKIKSASRKGCIFP